MRSYIITLLVVASFFISSKSYTSDFKDQHDSLKSAEKEMLEELKLLKASIPEIIEFHKKINKSLSVKLKNENDPRYTARMQLLNEYDSKFGRLVLFLFSSQYEANFLTSNKDDAKFEVDPAKITKTMDQVITKISSGIYSQCFNPDKKTFLSSEICKKITLECERWGIKSKDRQLFLNELTDELKIQTVTLEKTNDLNNFEDFYKDPDLKGRSKDFEIQKKIAFKTCDLLSQTGVNIENDVIVKRSRKPVPWIEELFNTCENFGKCSTAIDNPEMIANLMELNKKYPKKWPISNYMEAFEKIKKAVLQTAKSSCSDVHFIKDTAIITYATAGCDIRDVTLNDIQKDISDSGSYWTEAQKLNHETMHDRLLGCQSAKKLGATWNYIALKVEKDCKRKTRN